MNTLLQSYGLSAAQKTSCLLDHTGWVEQSSVLMDQLIDLKSDSLDDVIKALFFRKMPTYIRDVVNPKDYKELYDLTQWCNEVWENMGMDAGVMSTAACCISSLRPTTTVAALHLPGGSGTCRANLLIADLLRWAQPLVAIGNSTIPAGGQLP